MYCSGCGAALAAGLNYCKQCGRRVGGDDSESVAKSIADSLSYVGGFGLAGFMLGAFMLLKAGISSSALIWISVLYLSALFGICFLMLRQTSRYASMNRQHDTQTNAAAYERELRPGPTTSQLGEAAPMPASVVEHTTRTLEKVER